MCRSERFDFLSRNILRLFSMLQNELAHARFIRPNRLEQFRAKLKEFKGWKLGHILLDSCPFPHSIVFTIDLKKKRFIKNGKKYLNVQISKRWNCLFLSKFNLTYVTALNAPVLHSSLISALKK